MIMSPKRATYSELKQKLQKIDPLLVEAIDDVDETLIEEFAALSLIERIRWASDGATTLAGFQIR